MKKIKTITLTSLGLTGKEYISRLKSKKYYISSLAENISENIPKSKKGTKYEIVIIKSSEFTKGYPTTQEIREEAKIRGYITPPVEIAILLCEQISNSEMEEMGLDWLVTMHEPIIDSDGSPYLLSSNRVVGGRRLRAYYGRSTNGWYRQDGFVFLAPQVSDLSTSEAMNSELVSLDLKSEFNRGYKQGLDDAIQALGNLKNI